MLQTAPIFLTEIANLPMQVQPENYTDAVLISHDQLNLAAFSPELLAAKPLLIFVESLAYATFIPHHKKKLVYILSSQRHFAIECHKNGFAVVNLFTEGDLTGVLAEFLAQYPNLNLTCMQPSEWDTRSEIESIALKFSARVNIIPNNFFIADPNKFKAKIKKGYRLETFYRELRRQTGYLMDGNNPVGGKWNYDKENRKSLPKKIAIPAISGFAPDPVTQEVITFVDKFLPDSFGQTQGFNLAVSRQQAIELAQQFILDRLNSFGPFEDAIKTGEPFLFHSVLSIYLNNGLLLPQEICEMSIDAYNEGKAALNSVEGLIRQIIGWREYVRVYYEAMMPDVRQSNHFGFTHNLPQMYWDGDTDLKCLQDAIGNAIDYAYTHHIQRLMVLSNFSNLTFSNPIQLNQWFWVAYADAYEWVVLPNVLGMSTFADGGVLASKPYVSGGNYINKMSDCCSKCKYDVKLKTGERACPFNYLYWNFVDVHRQDFSENGRVSLMTNMYEAKSTEEKAAIRDSADRFIQKIKR